MVAYIVATRGVLTGRLRETLPPTALDVRSRPPSSSPRRVATKLCVATAKGPRAAKSSNS